MTNKTHPDPSGAFHFPTATERGPFPFPTSRSKGEQPAAAGAQPDPELSAEKFSVEKFSAEEFITEELSEEELRLMADTMPGEGPGD
jgi:Tfp pilus assembly protein PilP